MSKKLRLVKRQKKQGRRPVHRPVTARSSPQGLNPPAEPAMSPAEASEVARFRALTVAKAARRARVHRLLAELEKTA